MRRNLFLLSIFLLAQLLVSLTFAQSSHWPRHIIDNFSSGADGVRLADVNGDSLPDITTGWEEGGFTKVYLHPGYAAVQELWPSVLVGKTPAVEDAVFADLDGDGAMDVISCTEGQDRKIYIHWAPKTPAAYLDSSAWITKILPASDSLMQWMFSLAMQVDGKNGLDIVAGGKGQDAYIGWFEAPEHPHELEKWIWHPISPATWVMSFFLRDMDSDGDLDIVTSDRKPGASNGVRWLEQLDTATITRTWPNHFIGAQGREVMFMDMADLDGDGLEDALVTEYSKQQIHFLRKLDKSGLRWQTHVIDLHPLAGRAKAVRVGDIDGDGQKDIVHSANTLDDATKYGLMWLSPKGQPTESDWSWRPISAPDIYKFDRIELLDLDGDGDLDVLTCEENNGAESQGLGVVWYENPLPQK